MSANKFKPHLLILPEDEADQQLATGFVLAVENQRQTQVLNVAGGWRHVVTSFEKDLAASMRQFPARHVVLLIDFDDAPERRAEVTASVPEDLRPRVFIIGALSTPEALKSAGIGPSHEAIGQRLGRACRDGTRDGWNEPLLEHNNAELNRLCGVIQGILFP